MSKGSDVSGYGLSIYKYPQFHPKFTPNCRAFCIGVRPGRNYDSDWDKTAMKRETDGKNEVLFEDGCIIGFDTEYQNLAAVLEANNEDVSVEANKEKQNLYLSYQFNAKWKGKEWSGIGYPAEGERLSLADFLSWVVSTSPFSKDGRVDCPNQFVLVCHFSRADLPSFSDFYTKRFKSRLMAIRKTFITGTKGAQLEDNGVLGPYWPTVASASSSTLRIGQDLSISAGGYNTWFANNFSVTAGAGNDSLVDSPTNYGTDTGVGGEVRGNYCTLNPIAAITSNTSTNGNLDTSVANASSVRGTFPLVSGKWYWEVVPTSTANNAQIGICSATNIDTIPQVTSTGWCYNQSTGNKFNDPTGSAYGASYAQNDVIGIALDMDTGKIWWSKNGVWQASGNPATGANAAFTNVTGTVVPVIATTGAGVSGTFTSNFGQRPFAYTAPTGYKALCTTNLPQPIIQKPSSYMDVVTYTGNGATQTISGLGFSPDLVWIKARDKSGLYFTGNKIFDTTRGAYKALFSEDTVGDQDYTSSDASLTSFNSNGFTLKDISTGGWGVNESVRYVAWAWDEAPIAGMDIVSYTGTGVARTVAHNLGVAPKMIIVKDRDLGSANWCVYHTSSGAGNYLILNSTAANTASTVVWNNTAPTSSEFSLGAFVGSNANGDRHIAYLFAEVEGFSKFGSYTGNGSADGPFVWCGFRPRWVMVKQTNATASHTGIENLSQFLGVPDSYPPCLIISLVVKTFHCPYSALSQTLSPEL